MCINLIEFNQPKRSHRHPHSSDDDYFIPPVVLDQQCVSTKNPLQFLDLNFGAVIVDNSPKFDVFPYTKSRTQSKKKTTHIKRNVWPRKATANF